MKQQLAAVNDSGNTRKASLSRELAKEILLFVEENKLELLSSANEDFSAADGSGMELSLYVEHLNIVDAVFDRFGVEEEQYSAAIA